MCWTSFTGCYVRRDLLASETATLRLPNRILIEKFFMLGCEKGSVSFYSSLAYLIIDFKLPISGRGHV